MCIAYMRGPAVAAVDYKIYNEVLYYIISFLTICFPFSRRGDWTVAKLNSSHDSVVIF